MRSLIKMGLVATALLMGHTALVAAGPFEDAMDVYNRGDYVTALALLRPLADHGDARAQYNLGVMYHFGLGVPRDDSAAMNWYRKSAAQGIPDAQDTIGQMYHDGEGVPQD